jgi:predicted Zn-dependent peptidase
VTQQIDVHRLENGMTLVAETMGEVSSAAFVFLTRSGAAFDPDALSGSATVLSEWVFRGAGDRDNRLLNEALDNLGLQRGSSVSAFHTRFSGALVADKLPEALELFSDILQKPLLEEDQFELCRQLALQSLESLEDDPRQKISLIVNEKYLPHPLGRPAPGIASQLKSMTQELLSEHWKRHMHPDGTVLAVAGKIDFSVLKAQIEELFSSWNGEASHDLSYSDCEAAVHHQPNDGAQVHIGVMYPSVHVSHPDYYKAMAAVSILSGGMGSRLFTEVREKRGLCYAVGASHEVVGSLGAVRCYLGSSPQQAQEGLDVMLGELVKLADGISEDELDRAKVGLRAMLIMQGESSGARALRCAGDSYHLGHVRSLSDIEKEVQALTVADVLSYAQEYKPEKLTVATLGPTELKVNLPN